MIRKILIRDKEVSLDNIRKAIIASFVIAALFAVLLVTGILFFVNERNDDARIINLAGRQRMLSQKIAKNLYGLPNDGSLRSEIQKDALLWDSIHNALRFGNAALEIPRSDNSSIDSLFTEITPYQQKLYGLVKKLKAEGPYEILDADISIWEGKFLIGMDRIVGILQADDEKGIAGLTYIIPLFVFLFVLFIFGLYKILVGPIMKMVGELSQDKEEQRQRHRSILENTTDLIWSVDREYRLLAYNSAFSKAMKSDSGKAPRLGENVLNVDYSQKDMSERKRLYDRALSGKSFQTEFEIARKGTTSYHELSFRPIFGKEGKVTGCSIFNREVTERVETYRELQKSEAFLREAQEIANMGHWNWDIGPNVIKWSDHLYKVFGQNPSTFKANYESLMEIIHPRDREAFNHDVENAIENGELHDIVHRIVLGDGSIRYVHQKGRTYYGDDGRPERMAGTTQDVTQLENAKQRIMEQYDELQNFVYIISHNIRSPIANLQALVDLIEPGNEQANEMIFSNIGATVDALDRTIRDLNRALSLKKVSKDSFGEVDMEGVLRDIQQLLALDIGENMAKIEHDFSMAPKAPGIKSYFTNILYNLVLNAINYRAANREPYIKVVSRPTATGGVEIIVSDNGIGMDLTGERCKKIFDMYGRLSGNSEGRGLGLYLVRTQVEAMKGSIKVDSEPNKGSTFTIVFDSPVNVPDKNSIK